jgi:hypothetical protein
MEKDHQILDPASGHTVLSVMIVIWTQAQHLIIYTRRLKMAKSKAKTTKKPVAAPAKAPAAKPTIKIVSKADAKAAAKAVQS